MKISASIAKRAQEHMDHDATLLHSLRSYDQPVLHCYEWLYPALSYGYFIDPLKHLCPKGVEREGYEIAKRPTGGGIVFHTCDLAFSLVLSSQDPLYSKNSLLSYSMINAVVAKAIAKFLGRDFSLLQSVDTDSSYKHFCMAYPTKYDVTWQGKKIGGAALRRSEKGLLYQGSICLTDLCSSVAKEILLEKEAIEKMRASSYYLLGPGANREKIAAARCHLKELLAECFETFYLGKALHV